jgi:hypothetical protein
MTDSFRLTAASMNVSAVNDSERVSPLLFLPSEPIKRTRRLSTALAAKVHRLPGEFQPHDC